MQEQNTAFDEKYLNSLVENNEIEDYNIKNYNRIVVKFSNDYITPEEINKINTSTSEILHICKVVNLKSGGITAEFEF